MPEKKRTYKYKPKIKSQGKSYGIEHSAFFRLQSIHRLEKDLFKSVSELKALSSDKNYHVFDVKQNNKTREIQAPKLELDIVHTRIASLLSRCQLPNYLHSGVKGRSNITNAKVHIGNHPVLTMDIRKFYPSVSKKSIYHFFHQTMQTAPDVAGILTEICSYNDHIPTGSRLSMLLAFWSNFNVFSEIERFCTSKSINMSVFVDDLTFSGKEVNRSASYKIRKIVEGAGLSVHKRKTQLYAAMKPKLVTGVVLDGYEMKLRNEHHKSIYTSFQNLKSYTNDEELEKAHKRLVGKLTAAGQISSIFSKRAKTMLANT